MYSPFVTFVIYHAALFSDNDMEGSVKDDLTPELIDAVVAFVEAAAWSEKNTTKRVYYNERGTSVTVESIRPVLEHTWLADDVRSITMSCYLSA